MSSVPSRQLAPRAPADTASRIEHASDARLARLIRPSGYFRQKARKLKAFVGISSRAPYGGSLARMFRTPDQRALREQLLAVHGIGPETADSILLYAGKPSPLFVVDAYTAPNFRPPPICASGKAGLESVRHHFQTNLRRTPRCTTSFTRCW